MKRESISRSSANSGGKSPAEVRAMFARVAQRYDFLNHFLSLRRDIYWRQVAAGEVAGLDEHDVIVDLCTGTGDLAFALRQAAPTSRIIGLDFTPEMIALAARKAALLSRPALFATKNGETTGSHLKSRQDACAKIMFALGDSLALPLQDNSVALISVAFGIRNIANLERGLSEMIRIARPGGKIVALEFTKPNGWFFGPLYMFYFRFILPILGQLFAVVPGDAYRYLPQSVQTFAGPNEMIALLRKFGLKNVRATPLTFGVAHLYVGVK
ncbi:MAG: class I SAM-dependent methyltransferase [Planctomycetota bacterium]